jgi:urease subunit gamma/beta
MRLLPWEEDRILIFSAAELARRTRAAGLRLNHPEAVAIVCDAMLAAARGGGSYDDVVAAGRHALTEDDVMDGVRPLLDEVRLEVLVGDGTRLVVLVDPLGPVDPLTRSDARDRSPSADRDAAAEDDIELAPGRDRIRLRVENSSRRVVRVSSHYPFDRTNPRLLFDRAAASGFRLDVPSGASIRWAPGEIREVDLVRYGGRIGDEPARGRDGEEGA